MKNTIREKFEQNKKTLGTFTHLQSGNAIECLGYANLDYVIIDMEHSAIATEGAERGIAAAKESGIEPFVRVNEILRSPILKMLDAGAKGLIVPCVETVEQVKQLVQYAKFIPVGARGFCPTRGGGWGFAPHASGSIADYMQTCNRETLLLPQCETIGCLENIEDIAALEGVDGIFIGPFDLSIAMGKPAQFDDLEFKQAISRILKACKAAKKMCFIFAASTEAANKYFEDGFDSVTIGLDTNILINAYRDIVSKTAKIL
jgi:4-hydroxy-2-oxoheptanedioate aldolase